MTSRTDTLTDLELAHAVASGEISAFEELYRRYQRKVYSLCLRMLGNVPDAEDATQEVFLQLYRKIETFKGTAALSTWLHRLTVNTVLMYLRSHRRKQREQLAEDEEMEPLIADASVDVVVSNCVLNLIRPEDKQKLFAELFRVLKKGGRAVVSDIVCDEDPTPSIQADPQLWSGCIAGAFREDQFLEMFEDAGFYGIEILSRQDEPWQVIEGIEFRSVTVRAFKGKQGPCLERNQAVIYKGPWKSVRDDDGHTLYRGQRMAVCDKTFKILTDPAGPYSRDMIAVPPYEEIPLDQAPPFNCKGTEIRHPRETKGLEYRETVINEGAVCECGPGGC